LLGEPPVKASMRFAKRPRARATERSSRRELANLEKPPYFGTQL
jgi:hypothetical protein